MKEFGLEKDHKELLEYVKDEKRIEIISEFKTKQRANDKDTSLRTTDKVPDFETFLLNSINYTDLLPQFY